MPADLLLPDPEQLLIAFLITRPTVTAITTSTRIGTVLAAGQNASIRITTVSGDVPQHHEANATLEVECWGGTRAEASALARTVVSVLPDIKGSQVSFYDVTLGPFSRPDPVSERPRFIVDVQLITHP